MTKLKCFYYKDELHIRLVPAKPLFNSTLVHEVVNRGDVFAMRVKDQQLTIVPGKAEVTHIELPVDIPLTVTTQANLFDDPI